MLKIFYILLALSTITHAQDEVYYSVYKKHVHNPVYNEQNNEPEKLTLPGVVPMLNGQSILQRIKNREKDSLKYYPEWDSIPSLFLCETQDVLMKVLHLHQTNSKDFVTFMKDYKKDIKEYKKNISDKSKHEFLDNYCDLLDLEIGYYEDMFQTVNKALEYLSHQATKIELLRVLHTNQCKVGLYRRDFRQLNKELNKVIDSISFDQTTLYDEMDTLLKFYK